MEKINWGIIGCGDVTEKKSGPAFNKVPYSKLVAVMRRDAVKAEDYAKRHQVPKWYADADELIQDPEINAIYVATPPDSHEKYAIASFEAGKPVYLEKPMSLDARSSFRILQKAQEKALPFSVAHYRRAQPKFRKIKSLVKYGEIGKILLVNLFLAKPPLAVEYLADLVHNWRINPVVSGGGLFHDLAPHQLDLMIYFFGEVEKAYGLSLNQGGHYDADDFVTGTILFKNQVVFNGTWSFTAPGSEDLVEIIGTNGKITFSVFGSNEVRLEKNGQVEILDFPNLQHVQQPMIEQVVKYFLEHIENPSPAEEALRVMELIDTFTQSGKKS